VVQNSKATEIKRMLERGIRATINSDDPAYFRGYITDNLKTAQAEGGLSRDEVIRLVRNAFEISWAPEAKRASFLQRLDDYVSARL
jgi:adenosine deaminase